MNEEKKILQFLGLAARARKIVTGEELVINEVRSGKAKLVIISGDAADNTKKKVTDKCMSFNVEKHVFGNREILGHAIGKDSRVVLAITDTGFASKMSGLLNDYKRG